MYLSKMWKAWQRHAGAFADRQPQRRRPQRRPSLFLEPLEDRTLLTAWTAIGPAPLEGGQYGTAGELPTSGRVTGLAADPNNPNLVYAATAGGGIWESANATSNNPTWTPLTDNLTDSSGNPLPLFMGAVAETDATSGQYSGNQIVYAGMGEANDSADSYYGEGILVSTNGGTTWTLTNAGGDFTRRAVAKIAIDPSDTTGGTAYAAVVGNAENGLTGNTGIWKTTNFGQTWTNTTGAAGLSTKAAWTDVVVDPHTPGTVYAAQGDFSGAAGNGIYKSIDGGTTWSLLNGTGSYNGAQDGRIALALYDDGTTDELFAFIAQPTNAGNIFQLLESTDGGNTFTALTSNPGLIKDFSSQGGYDITLAVDPFDSNYIYLSGDQINQGPTFTGSPLESFDGGQTWHDIATDSKGNGPHTDSHASAFDANGNLLEGDDGGVFLLSNPTDPSTQLWTSLNTNLNTIQFYGIGVDTTQSNVVYGGSQDNGTEKYTGSLGWEPIAGSDGAYTQVDPTNNNRVYLEYSLDNNLSLSTNGGATFKTISNGVKYNKSGGSPIVQNEPPFVLDSSGNVYYGTDYLNYSSDQGKGWTQIGAPGINNFNKGDYAITSIAVASNNNNVVYVATGDGTFVTQNAQDGGNKVTWKEIDLPGNATVGFLNANSLAIDPADTTDGTVYAVINSFTTSGASHVFMTTNSGSKWTDISGNLPDYPADSVTVSPDGSTVYVGTDVGVYSTSNVNGASTTWTPLGTGLPNAQVVEIEDVPSQNLLVVGTHGRGAWELSTITAPSVTTNPSNQTVTAGQTATFTNAANGNPAPTVQWQVSSNGGSTWTNISGATSTTLTLTNVAAAMNGDEYQAVFTNSAGSVTTSAATLTVQFAPTVTTNPSNQTVTAGQNATFTAAANGNPAPTVQWEVSTDSGKTFSVISGATSSTLSLTSVTTAMNANQYEAVFTNSVGSVTSSTAVLAVQAAPVITSANSAVFTVGQGSGFTVTATGSPTPSLTESGALPSGIVFTASGNGTATLAGVPAAGTQGTYHISLTAHNGAGSDFTQSFTLTVNAPPSPPSPPPAPTLSVPPVLALLDSFMGGAATVNADGSETITYSLFGFPLIVAQYDSSGNFLSASLFGINVPNWIWNL